MAALEKMHIVRRGQADAELARKLWQHAIAFLLRVDSVIVQFEEKIIRAENIAKFGHALTRLRKLIRLDRHIDLAFQAAAQPDQPG